ncbi:hypothetical protein ACR6C2_04170 [Streptomyces sp. INA 01156]
MIAYPAFGPSVATANRLWNDYLFPLLLLLVGAGGLLGNLAVRHYRRGAVPVAAAAAILCVCVTAVLAVSLHDLESDMRVRARAWDSQDRLLRERAAAGATVLPYKPLVVSSMLEPFGSDERPWPASCVARYYQVEKVTDGTEHRGRDVARAGPPRPGPQEAPRHRYRTDPLATDLKR